MLLKRTLNIISFYASDANWTFVHVNWTMQATLVFKLNCNICCVRLTVIIMSWSDGILVTWIPDVSDFIKRFSLLFSQYRYQIFNGHKTTDFSLQFSVVLFLILAICDHQQCHNTSWKFCTSILVYFFMPVLNRTINLYVPIITIILTLNHPVR